MDKISVKQLAMAAGVSVRTLHHYDKIGLLKPSIRSESNYRYYSKEELLRLQQILLYKEMDMPLSQIAGILDDPDFDTVNALKQHKNELKKKRSRLSQLLLTVDRTIKQLKLRNKMDYNELYKGFSKEDADAYRKEASERWGLDTIANSEKKFLSMDKSEWNAILQKGEDLNKALAAQMHLAPNNEQVQLLITEHYKWIGLHFDVTPESYKGLADVYVEDERFKTYYEKYNPGFATFLKDAMYAFADKR